jgi:peptide deformylase
MAILKIARMGHPVLRERSAEVDDPTSPEIARLVADLNDTLDDAGGVGLAAPQVRVALRVVVFEVPGARASGEDEEPLPRTVLINPRIEPLGEEIAVDWEACLSVPELRGAVPRRARIRYRALAPDGTRIEREASGFHARVVQHECDHLDGILYPLRMTDLSTLHYVSEMRYDPALRGPAEPGLDDVA